MDNDMVVRLFSICAITACVFMECATGVSQKDIRLTDHADRDNPNAGRLEISRRGSWGGVCDENWNQIDRDVACRHLGYLNASSVRLDGRLYGGGNGKVLMESPECNGDEDRLWDCQYNDRPTCEPNEGVSLVCHIPGNIGCYEFNVTAWYLSTRPTRHFRSTAMTIEHCIDFCHHEGFPIAGLHNRADCYCEVEYEVFDLNRKTEEVECHLPCTGGKDQACGGANTRSLYNVSATFCPDNLAAPVGGWTGIESRFFGQTATFGCNNGVQLIGHDVIQCILGNSPNEVRWSEDVPFCFGATEGPNTPSMQGPAESEGSIFETNGVLFWSIGAVAALLLVALILISITMGIQRHNQIRRFRTADDTSVDFDLEPAGPSGTYRHSVHSLHVLGQIEDNDENNRQEEQQQQKHENHHHHHQLNVAPMYLREEVKGGVGMQANELAVFGLQNHEDLEWDEDMDSNGELDSDLEIDPRTSTIQYVGRTAL